MAVELSCADLLPLNARSLTLPEIVELACKRDACLPASNWPKPRESPQSSAITFAWIVNINHKNGVGLSYYCVPSSSNVCRCSPGLSSYVANLAMNDLDCTHSEIVTQAFPRPCRLIAPHLK